MLKRYVDASPLGTNQRKKKNNNATGAAGLHDNGCLELFDGRLGNKATLCVCVCVCFCLCLRLRLCVYVCVCKALCERATRLTLGCG